MRVLLGARRCWAWNVSHRSACVHPASPEGSKSPAGSLPATGWGRCFVRCRDESHKPRQYAIGQAVHNRALSVETAPRAVDSFPAHVPTVRRGIAAEITKVRGSLQIDVPLSRRRVIDDAGGLRRQRRSGLSSAPQCRGDYDDQRQDAMAAACRHGRHYATRRASRYARRGRWREQVWPSCRWLAGRARRSARR